MQCPMYHDETDKRRHPRNYKPIYLFSSSNNDSELCNNIFEYLYHPLVYQYQACTSKRCQTKNCPYNHQGISREIMNYKFLPKLETAFDQANKEQIQIQVSHLRYVQKREVSFFEDITHEFKNFKSLRVDLIFNYICAFLNSHGGTLYIGITDDGSIKGIKLTRSEIDAFQLELDNTLRHFDPCVMPQQVEIQFVPVHSEEGIQIQNCYIIEIEIRKLKKELYFTHLNEAYVKRQASINMLKPKEIKDYMLLLKSSENNNQ